MIPKTHAVIRSGLLALLGVLALQLPGCGGGTGDPESDDSPVGHLELGSRTRLDGVRYELEASFVVSGADPDSFAARPGAAHLSLELAPGAYTVELQPGYQVYQDQAVALTAIDAELLSDATQAFEIAAAATTRVEYRFVIAAGTLVFGGDERE